MPIPSIWKSPCNSFMMKLLLIFLLPITVWADYLFVLYDAGETVALTPVIEELVKRGEEVKVVSYRGLGRYEEIAIEELEDADVVVTGTASKVQLQTLKYSTGKRIAYYDNPLPIDSISYAPLIREFEEAVDLFLVPSEVAKDSSRAKQIEVVGNPDLDTYCSHETKRGVITYFGGYDPDYRAAFEAFLRYAVPLDLEVVIRPHSKTDGSLEKELIAHFPNISLGDPDQSALEAVKGSEIIACHRSSMAIKASCAGKEVVCIDAEGNITHPPTRDELKIPSGAVGRVLDLL